MTQGISASLNLALARVNYIEQNFSVEYKSETYKTFGLSEQNLNEILKDQIKNKDKVFISIFSRGLDNDIVIKAKSDNVKFEEYRRAIFVKLENYIYSVQDLSMPLTLEKQLHDTNTSIAVVGDLSIKFLMKNLTDKTLQSNLMLSACLPNDSSKIKYGISKQTITKFGEVSPEVAYEIAVSLLDKTNCELVVSSLVCLDGQDRGTTYIAIGNKAKIDIYKNCFAGSNEEILNNLSATTMFYLIKKLKTRDFKTI